MLQKKKGKLALKVTLQGRRSFKIDITLFQQIKLCINPTGKLLQVREFRMRLGIRIRPSDPTARFSFWIPICRVRGEHHCLSLSEVIRNPFRNISKIASDQPFILLKGKTDAEL